MPCSILSGAPTPRPALWVFLLLALLTVAGFAPHPAAASVYTVTSAADDGGSGTLRYEVSLANENGGGDVYFSPSLGGATITETQGAITLTAPITIAGPGPGITISGNNANTVFAIEPANSSQEGSNTNPYLLQNLTITDGYNASSGGGGVYISSNAYAIFNNCTFTDNMAAARFGVGGGLCNYGGGTVTLNDCALTGNKANFVAGGLYNGAGTVTLTNCILTGNTAQYGGGLDNDNGTLTLTGSTLSGNDATVSGYGGSVDAGGGSTTLTDDILYGDTGGEIHADDDSILPGGQRHTRQSRQQPQLQRRPPVH